MSVFRPYILRHNFKRIVIASERSERSNLLACHSPHVQYSAALCKEIASSTPMKHRGLLAMTDSFYFGCKVITGRIISSRLMPPCWKLL